MKNLIVITRTYVETNKPANEFINHQLWNCNIAESSCQFTQEDFVVTIIDGTKITKMMSGLEPTGDRYAAYMLKAFNELINKDLDTGIIYHPEKNGLEFSLLNFSDFVFKNRIAFIEKYSGNTREDFYSEIYTPFAQNIRLKSISSKESFDRLWNFFLPKPEGPLKLKLLHALLQPPMDLDGNFVGWKTLKAAIKEHLVEEKQIAWNTFIEKVTADDKLKASHKNPLDNEYVEALSSLRDALLS